MRASFAVVILFLAFPLAAADFVTLGAEKPFDDFPHLVGDLATIGRLIPNDDGYFLLFTRGTDLWAMQIDRAGQPADEWPLPAKVSQLRNIGVRARTGLYLVAWVEEGADRDTLAAISADGHKIVHRNLLPPTTFLDSFDCGLDRCLGATQGLANEIFAFSLLGEPIAGPVQFGRVNLSASVVADGAVFKVAWAVWTDPPSAVHVLTVDGTAKILSDEHLSETGRFVTAARGNQPVYFFADGDVDVKAVVAGQPPKTIARLMDGSFVSGISAAWNGSEFLVVVNAIPPGGWLVFE